MARQDQLHAQLSQDGQDVPGIAQDVPVAPGSREVQEVVVDHQYLRSSVPPSKLRVEPGVVLATYLSLVEIRLAGVQGHHLGLPFGAPKAVRLLSRSPNRSSKW
jgi:hypothetical protein